MPQKATTVGTTLTRWRGAASTTRSIASRRRRQRRRCPRSAPRRHRTIAVLASSIGRQGGPFRRRCGAARVPARAAQLRHRCRRQSCSRRWLRPPLTRRRCRRRHPLIQCRRATIAMLASRIGLLAGLWARRTSAASTMARGARRALDAPRHRHRTTAQLDPRIGVMGGRWRKRLGAATVSGRAVPPLRCPRTADGAGIHELQWGGGHRWPRR
mmetsp:Transcript_137596/g.343389  ORF Transcript_137596/g.343389 Transcript_137596/m.343389 type:complete len:213 (+) Transcript_137596:508-1146(+)